MRHESHFGGKLFPAALDIADETSLDCGRVLIVCLRSPFVILWRCEASPKDARTNSREIDFRELDLNLWIPQEAWAGRNGPK